MSVPAPPYRATIYLTRMKPRREATIVIPDDWPLPFADNEALDLDGIKVWIHHASQPRRVPIFAGVAVLEFPEAFGAVLAIGTADAWRNMALLGGTKCTTLRAFGDSTPLPETVHA